jgi:hypothetical protein
MRPRDINEYKDPVEDTDQMDRTSEKFNELGLGDGVDIVVCDTKCVFFRRRNKRNSGNEGRCEKTGETVYARSSVCGVERG